MSENKELIVLCPHCKEFIIIQELNCCIFRHGILKNTGEQIDPHTNKEECETLKEKGLLFRSIR